MTASADPPVEEESYFEGYSDYKSVTKDINDAVARALDGYGAIVGKGRVDQATCDRAVPALLAAGMRLLPEIEESKAAKPELQEIYTRWVGEKDAEGFIDEVTKVHGNHIPEKTIQQFAFDIRKAAFKLGYLKAGEQRNGESTDVDNQQSEQMFDNL